MHQPPQQRGREPGMLDRTAARCRPGPAPPATSTPAATALRPSSSMASELAVTCGGRHRADGGRAPVCRRGPAAARAHPAAAGQDFSLGARAGFLGGFCDTAGLAEIDLVANDTGGAVAQIFAARQPGRLRRLTLTDCETHDNVPPRAFLPTVLLARMGSRLLRDLPRARRRVYGSSYQDVSRLPLKVVRAWLEPLLGTPAAVRQFQRWVASLHDRDLLAAESVLRRLQVPTLIVWSTGDVFFHRKWAYWLRGTIPGAAEVTEIPGARLFFPDERATELTAALRRHW
jgi:pimeloyl-ACP methyl ester carboxylesterase